MRHGTRNFELWLRQTRKEYTDAELDNGMRRFMKQYDATIETTGTWKPLRGRKDYVALVEVFANKNFTAK
jgi:hypothetical protein